MADDRTVTVAIPTYQSEEFIERTLTSAREQTHREIRILVSIDASTDRTEEICRAVATEDSRVTVIPQQQRLGWVRNTNTLIERVQTPYFFLYFHDDVIERDYVEALLGAMEANHGAASAHGDVRKFGRVSTIEPGSDHVGSGTERLLSYLTGDLPGPLLRGLIRSRAIDPRVRFPEIAANGAWLVPPFAMALLAAGPSIRVPGNRYHRWMREGSMTTDWLRRTPEELALGYRKSVELQRIVIESVSPSDEEFAILEYALYLRTMLRVRSAEKSGALWPPLSAEHVDPAFPVTRPSFPGLRTDLRTSLDRTEQALSAAERDSQGPAVGVRRALQRARRRVRR